VIAQGCFTWNLHLAARRPVWADERLELVVAGREQVLRPLCGAQLTSLH
jgi:hypothetical protein